MKNNYFLQFIAICTLSLASCNTNKIDDNQYSQHVEYDSKYPTPQTMQADLSTSVTKVDLEHVSSFKISPYIYGSSFENLDNTTYGGIWSEILMDRKFFKGLDGDQSVWTSAGSTRVVNKGLDGGNAITIDKDGSISQKLIPLDRDKEYTGYFYASGTGTIELSYTNGSNSIVKTFDIDSSTLKKFEYEIKSPSKSKQYVLTVKSTKGTITVDAFSLMPKDNYMGMRKDTIDKLKEMQVPLLRWPGGDAVSGYDFYDGIGDIDKRPTKENLAWSYRSTFMPRNFYFTYDSNDFGLEEFLALCKYVGAEPNIVVNSGYGDSTMAANEVEFVNGTSNSTYGKKRSLSNKPYNVKIWSVGNEMFGGHELGHTSASEYVKKHNAFVKAMKAKDSSIEIIASGDNGSMWSQQMVDSCVNNFDYLSQHFYAKRNEDNLEQHIRSMYNLSAETRIRAHRELNGIGNKYLSIDEYGYLNVTSASRLKDGMGVAATLNTFIKNGDVVKICCFSETVNSTQGTLTTDDFGAYRQANGNVLDMYRRLNFDRYVPISYHRDTKNFYLMAATINENHDEIVLSVINSTDKSILVNGKVFKDVKYIEYLTGDSINSVNAFEKEKLHHYKSNLSGTSFIVKPLSISLVKIGI